MRCSKVNDAKIASIQHVYLTNGWMKKLLALEFTDLANIHALLVNEQKVSFLKEAGVSLPLFFDCFSISPVILPPIFS